MLGIVSIEILDSKVVENYNTIVGLDPYLKSLFCNAFSRPRMRLSKFRLYYEVYNEGITSTSFIEIPITEFVKNNGSFICKAQIPLGSALVDTTITKLQCLDTTNVCFAEFTDSPLPLVVSPQNIINIIWQFYLYQE